MEIRSKSKILGEYKTRIRLIDEFVKVIELLKDNDIVKAYNGKKLTKRFTDKVQTILPDYIKIDLTPQSWSHFLNISIWFDNYIVKDRDIHNYIPYKDSHCNIDQYESNKYEPEDYTYCVNGVREFNYDIFVKCAERKIKLLQNEKQQYQLSIDNIDEVIQKTKELEKLVRDTISTFPAYIKPMVTFDYLIRDDW